MAGGKRKKTGKNVKRTYRKKRRDNYRLVTMYAPSGCPTQNIVKMRYVENISISSPLGVMGLFVFRANSIFDPNLTGTGHQPMGHDQMAALYQRYSVLGSKLHATIYLNTNGATNENTSTAVGVHLSKESGTIYTVYRNYIEANKGSWALLTKNRDVKELTSTFSAKKYFDVQDVKDNGTQHAGVGANPVREAFYKIFAQTVTSDNSTVYATVVIDYIVQFSDPQSLGES